MLFKSGELILSGCSDTTTNQETVTLIAQTHTVFFSHNKPILRRSRPKLQLMIVHRIFGV